MTEVVFWQGPEILVIQYNYTTTASTDSLVLSATQHFPSIRAFLSVLATPEYFWMEENMEERGRCILISLASKWMVWQCLTAYLQRIVSCIMTFLEFVIYDIDSYQCLPMTRLLPIAMFTLPQYFVSSSQNENYGKRRKCLLGEVRLCRKAEDKYLRSLALFLYHQTKTPRATRITVKRVSIIGKYFSFGLIHSRWR